MIFNRACSIVIVHALMLRIVVDQDLGNAFVIKGGTIAQNLDKDSIPSCAESASSIIEVAS